MFEAFVLVCLISKPALCSTLEDLEGPYKDRSTCIHRAYEIASEIPTYLPMYVATQYMCTQQSKGIGI